MDEKITKEIQFEEVKPDCAEYENEETGAVLVEAEAEALPEHEEKSKPSFITFLLFDAVSIVSSAILVVALCFMLLFRTVGVVGSSMVPTLENGDRIVLSAFLFEPKYGDIVVTCQPSKVDYIESTLVKRIIATEGQTVDIDFDKGIVYVDGEALNEPYVNELVHDRESFYEPVTVPEGYVFVMGDNRNASTDSRDSRIGLIRKEYVMGKALFKLSPFTKLTFGE